MAILRKALQRLLILLWLRPGTVRRAPIGGQRGLRFELSGPLAGRVSVFYRTYEKAVSDWMDSHVQPGMTVYVVGAHVGVHVLTIAKRLRGEGHIVAFEGWPQNFTHLQRNIALNPQVNVTIEAVPACVAAESGTIAMAQGDTDGKHHIKHKGDTTRIIEVPAITLDDYHRQHENTPALILVDVEGFEADVLRGATELITAHTPLLVLEHHGEAAALREILHKLGYTVNEYRRHLYATPT
jgi:FkbM family methyltransferase